MIDEYQQAYITKDDLALKGAVSALHSALLHNIKFPSKVDNSGTELHTGQYLATRTVNAFSGAHEWSLSFKVHAITGHRSFISSEMCWSRVTIKGHVGCSCVPTGRAKRHMCLPRAPLKQVEL
ncbi:hypothetical protein JG688_00017073 [Phytophthora aleatoria]|uniref:Uncharacterized protein n=1 Tax=Phytophthora aleatoria TaxID=2496075 RepID=A0A8J5IT40_9STRA|nr:hypothetical protein JG688_00017073 [Phytophthora aleatoria]